MWQPDVLASAPTSTGWTFREVIDAVGSMMNILVPLATVCIAFFGLQVWKKQLRAKTRMEHAIPLLRSALKLRDQLFAARSPLTTSDEAASAVKELGWNLDDIEKRRDKEEAAFGAATLRRRNALAAAVRDLDSERLRAEVVFGKEIVQPIRKMFDVVREVQSAFDAKGYGPLLPGIMGELSGDQRMKYDRIVYRATSRDELDEIDKKLDSPLQELRDILARDIDLDRA